MGADYRAERAEQERQEQAARDARRDRVADYTPADGWVHGPSRVAVIPVLLGGGGHGRPWSDDLALVRVAPDPATIGARDLIYHAAKFAVPNSGIAVRYCAWEGLAQGQAMALAWRWLVEKALPEPMPGGLTAEDFEAPLTDEERRKIEAMAAVLERHRGTLLRLSTAARAPRVEIVSYGTREELLRELLAAAEWPF